MLGRQFQHLSFQWTHQIANTVTHHLARIALSSADCFHFVSCLFSVSHILVSDINACQGTLGPTTWDKPIDLRIKSVPQFFWSFFFFFLNTIER